MVCLKVGRAEIAQCCMSSSAIVETFYVEEDISNRLLASWENGDYPFWSDSPGA